MSTRYHRGRRYCLIRIPLDWESARSLADTTGGHLVTLTDPAELAWAVAEFTDPENPAPFWTGATPSTTTPTTWTWDRTDTSNLPDDSTGTISPNHRLLLVPDPPPPGSEPPATAPPAAHRWHPTPGHRRHFFVIEWG